MTRMDGCGKSNFERARKTSTLNAQFLDPRFSLARESILASR